jgi:hypothetical protein
MNKCHWCGKENPEWEMPYNGMIKKICQVCVNKRTPNLTENVDNKELLLETSTEH